MRVLINVTGAVQGVGYRPFVLQKATEYCIKGYVKNLGASVEIFADGDDADVLSFVALLKSEAPEGAIVLDVKVKDLEDRKLHDNAENISGYCVPLDKNNSSIEFQQYNDFKIIESGEINLSEELPIFLPDIGICDKCMSEMLDESDRRFGYPLISCAGCGPRISILNKLPYDRDTTTMDAFKMCPKCAAEYKNGRRTHAQTISCHDCGPQYELELFKRGENYSSNSINIADNENISKNDDAINDAIEYLKNNKVLGLKGISGYQIIGLPNDEVTLKIRAIKGRENKPFAVMFSDVAAVREYCKVSDKEKELLESSARPIVLLEKKKDFPYEVCKDSRYIGAFLPSAGIHRLLCDGAGPLICTSANISDEPIIIDDEVFAKRFLKEDLVYGVLRHKRVINIPQDDSVIFVTELNDGEQKISFNRRSRGYTPLPVLLKEKCNKVGTVLAIGGDLKNTFSFAKNDRIITSPYIGDLKDYETLVNEKNLIKKFSELFAFSPSKIVCDMHPLYESGRVAKELAQKQNLPILEVQHHHAHILSVMAEKSLKSCIGIAFDGTGYGTDDKIWGGEILLCKNNEFSRVGHLSYVKLCGGDNAPKKADQVRQCYEYALDQKSDNVPGIVKAALSGNIGCYETSSVGRLFDAVSSLLDIRHENSFEGECAIALEKAAWEYVDEVKASFDHSKDAESYDVNDLLSKKFQIDPEDVRTEILEQKGCLIIDQTRLYKKIKALKEHNTYSLGQLSFVFHASLTDAILRICDIVRSETKEAKVCLSGGVFANRLLLKMSVESLKNAGFEVYTNEFVPAGDAGISLGQAYFGLMSDE